MNKLNAGGPCFEGVRILPNKVESARRKRVTMMALGILLAFYSSAFALDPSLDVSQYAHTAWKVGEALPNGAIHALAQTADGYLWIGTEFGLVRFDGVRAVPWQPPAGEHLPIDDVRSLQGARDGRLWIGTFRGLASWKDGKLTHYPELDGQVIEALLEDREGTIWVAGWAPSFGRLCKIQSGKTQCYGEDGRFGYGVTPLFEDSKGNLWAGAMNGLWRWKPGPPKLYPIPDSAERIYALGESDDGGILVVKRTGITKLRNGKTETYPISAGSQFKPYRLLRDRNGGLWIGAVIDSGLLHIHQGRTDVFSRADGLSSESIASLLEDREGSIWVATVNGLDRFREFVVPTMSVQQGFSSGGIFSILAARDGSLWLGTSNGLNRWNKGQITIYRNRLGAGDDSHTAGLTPAIGQNSKGTVREITDRRLPDQGVETLFEDKRGQIWVGTRKGVAIFKSDGFFPVTSVPYGIVYAISEDGAGNVWVSHEQGLFHLIQARVVERIVWAELGRREPATAVIADGRQGGLWLGFRDGGVGYFKDRQLRAWYGRTEGLGQGMVRSLYQEESSVWAATEDGLTQIKDGHVRTLTSQNGLPCNLVHWMQEDNAGSVWLYMACGLARIARSELDAWASHQKQTIKTTLFEASDGVSTHRYTGGYGTSVAKSADGKLWFLRVGGVSVLDPHRLAFNSLPPPVHVEQITADNKTYDAVNGLRLPPRVRNLAIDYTAVSLVIPEKVRFRIKLEGQDKDWRELVNIREMQYTNLAPGNYRFRVTACNNSGVWSEEGATLDFAVLPAWYQTNWFKTACVAAFLALLWAAYQLRVRQLAAQFNMRLDERVQERTRIARDLHDTLLQSFHGLLMNLQTVSRLLSRRPDEAQERLERTIEQAEEAIVEGRDAVQGLRASTVETNNLARAISALGEEFGNDATNLPAPVLRVEVEGASRDLHPILRDEIYRIAAEALRNAFRHAQARQIEVEIRYDPRQFRLRVRDDGRGFDPTVPVSKEQEGHYGLPGMRERAKIAGGKLKVWSEVGAGTEVELEIPAGTAYAKAQRRLWFKQASS